MRVAREICEAANFIWGNLFDDAPWVLAKVEKGRKLVTENPFDSPKFKEGYDYLCQLSRQYGTLNRGRTLGILESVTIARIDSIRAHLRNGEFQAARNEADAYLNVLPGDPTVESLQRLASKALAEGVLSVPKISP